VAMVSVDRVFNILQLDSDENQFGDLEHESFETKIEIKIDHFKYESSNHQQLEL